jgi:hypothetical protein
MVAPERAAGDPGLDARSVVIASLAAAVIFLVLIWVYSAVQVTASCHSTQGHIRIGKSLNGLVCTYHDEVTRVPGG